MNIEQFKGLARLPKFAIPSHYDLHLKLDLSAACNFYGTVKINLSITEKTNFLVLNANQLHVHQALFTTSGNQQYCPSDVVVDDDDEVVVLVFDETLCVGEGLLGIEFSGNLNEHLKGLYRCTYVDKEVKKNMAVTQFEAAAARLCFPCWDEPSLKATFKITLDAPSELTTLSNMPIIDEKLDGHVKTVYFEETPVMSTYLVAVVVGLFDHIEDTTADGVKVRAYCPVGRSDEGKFALELTIKSLDIFTKYFSTPYPLPKLDMVAVPEFAAGAMENFGLIVYRDNEMLYSDSKSTARRKQRMSIVVAHEVAHHWFGNLVTMEWWTHLWLNEGFATWVSYMATNNLFPEWNIWTNFLRETTCGLSLDALEQSHPVEVEVHHVHGVEQVFDDIGYRKGSAIIRMLQGYLGDDIFQKSLSSYIKKYSWKNAKTEDLWRVISEESGVNINSLMDCWTKQKGYPVIYVKSKDHILEFEQSQFLSSGLHGDGEWSVPISLALGSYIKCKNFLLESKFGTVDISEYFPSSDEKLWIKVNVEQSGFYRVMYEDRLAAQLRKAVENNCLLATDKFGILDDMFALCEACKQPLSSLLLLMNAYRNEKDNMVLLKLIDVCYDVVNISTDAIPDSVNVLKELFITLLQCSAEKLGWESIPEESHLDVMLRGEVFTALATFGHDKTRREAMQRFQVLLNDKNTPILSADMRKAAYISVMRNSSTTNRNGFESMLKFYREVDAMQEKERILQSLASSPDPDIVLEVLNFLVSDEVRDQDIIYGLVGLSLESREAAWRWLRENWDRILKKYGSGMLLHFFVREIVTPLSSNEKAEEVEAFFGSHVNPAVDKILKQSIERIRIKARWIQSIKQEQSLPDLVNQLLHKE
ncbi:hypothetical protein LWI28_018315 [Acer negundo]|uniref:Aminopeptidase n=1 Tax=Acer negundo TaxID=4023 RepID=A0AAD5IFQ6_ACENE|nr:hypothetical protein LWI28_018315 [Acer negundo]